MNMGRYIRYLTSIVCIGIALMACMTWTLPFDNYAKLGFTFSYAILIAVLLPWIFYKEKDK